MKEPFLADRLLTTEKTNGSTTMTQPRHFSAKEIEMPTGTVRTAGHSSFLKLPDTQVGPRPFAVCVLWASDCRRTALMRVRLTRKLAERIDGVDLSSHKIGDCFELPESEGQLLVAERWAFLERRAADRREHGAADRPRRGLPDRRA
jgi:hypothetical protein